MDNNENNPNLKVSSAFAASNVDDLMNHYAQWAETYDAENAALGFRLPALVAGMFARHVPCDGGPILDAGCGTGLAGECLSVLGYRELMGIDLSEPMLAQARKLKVYDHLLQMELGAPLNFVSGTFKAAVISGVFTEGHAPASSFEELSRVTRRGGFIVFNVRNDIYEDRGFKTKMDDLEKRGNWRLVERSQKFRPFTVGQENVFARLFCYEVS